MIFLKSVTINKKIDNDYYPFNLSIIKNFKEFHFDKPITILVGENGSGKSTLLEAIATNIGLPLIGGENIDSDNTLDATRELGKKMKLIWFYKPNKGFFLRANDFISFIKRLSSVRKEARKSYDEIKSKPLSTSTSYEILPYAHTLYDLKHFYGEGLEFNSHGEAFLNLFEARFEESGLYILDEPDVPLSPLHQLTLMSLIMDMVKQDSQFIIATHSPIIMALPDADIYVLEDNKLIKKDYNEVEHVKLTKDFLDNPERFIRHLR